MSPASSARVDWRMEPQTIRTFMVLTLDNPSESDVIAQRLERATPGVKFVTPQQFASETRTRILGNILPILIVVLILAFIVGLAVAGLTIYTATVEKSREYGILKAEGFTNPFLYRVVFEQSMITGFLGFLLGAGMTVEELLRRRLHPTTFEHAMACARLPDLRDDPKAWWKLRVKPMVREEFERLKKAPSDNAALWAELSKLTDNGTEGAKWKALSDNCRNKVNQFARRAGAKAFA